MKLKTFLLIATLTVITVPFLQKTSPGIRYFAAHVTGGVPGLVTGKATIEPTVAFPDLESLAAYRRSGWSPEGTPVSGSVTVLEFSGPSARITEGWVDSKFLARNTIFYSLK